MKKMKLDKYNTLIFMFSFGLYDDACTTALRLNCMPPKEITHTHTYTFTNSLRCHLKNSVCVTLTFIHFCIHQIVERMKIHETSSEHSIFVLRYTRVTARYRLQCMNAIVFSTPKYKISVTVM